MLFHPNAGRDSLKTKSCSKKDCRFYHLKGTKIVERQAFKLKTNFQAQISNQSNNQGTSSVETKIRFETLGDSSMLHNRFFNRLFITRDQL
jgi:hypothetical protein